MTPLYISQSFWLSVTTSHGYNDIPLKRQQKL